MRKNHFIFLFMLAILVINQDLFSQKKIEASFEYSEGKIFIYYEFQGNRENDYDVSIKLKRTSEPSFEIIPEDLTGDIGEGKFANKKNKITWVINEKEESQLEGEDFYFDVTAKEIKSGGGVPWYVFAGGAVLAGGTAAILVLGKKNSDESSTSSSSGTFPTPPLRP
jgi:hypothetical protein